MVLPVVFSGLPSNDLVSFLNAFFNIFLTYKDPGNAGAETG
jgi:hypothetical protein